MKTLIFLNGTMGVGKTTTAKALQQLLPRSVWLDGDWCWLSNPFVVTDETRAMVVDNITHLLGNFLRCSQYDFVLFSWVMHEQSIIDSLLAGLDTADCTVRLFTLTADKAALRTRLGKDVTAGLRSEDGTERSVARLPLYELQNTTKIDVSHCTARQAAERIRELL